MTKKKDNPQEAGRKGKYHTHIKPYLPAIEAMMRNGATLEILSQKFNVAISTLCEYKNKYPEFSEALKQNAEIADFTIESALFNMAKTDKVAAFFWLKNRQARRWRDKQHVFQQTTTTQRYEYDNLSDEELDKALVEVKNSPAPTLIEEHEQEPVSDIWDFDDEEGGPVH